MQEATDNLPEQEVFTRHLSEFNVVVEIKTNIEQIFRLTKEFEFSPASLAEIYKECLDAILGITDNFVEEYTQNITEACDYMEELATPEMRQRLENLANEIVKFWVDGKA